MFGRLSGDFSELADASRNVRAPFGRSFSKLADASRNVWAPLGRDLAAFTFRRNISNNHDVRPQAACLRIGAPLGRDFFKLADAIRNARAPFGRESSTLSDAIRNDWAPFGGDFSMSADAICHVWARMRFFIRTRVPKPFPIYFPPTSVHFSLYAFTLPLVRGYTFARCYFSSARVT